MKVAIPPWLIDLDLEHAYEPEVTLALERLVEPGFACADLGAHVGYFTLLLARLAGEAGTVVAFEASAENARIVERNVKLNGLDGRVTVEQAAVTDRSTAALPLYAGRTGGSMEWTMDAGFATRETGGAAPAKAAAQVRGLSLDEYFPPGSRLDLVKMDIEGAEAKAIPGMSRLLRDARPIVVLEFHREVGWPSIPALSDAGYSFFTLDGRPLEAFSGPDDVPYQVVAQPSPDA
jgi:FkbM family methyltransferase